MLGLAIVMGIACSFTALCHLIQCYKDGEIKAKWFDRFIR